VPQRQHPLGIRPRRLEGRLHRRIVGKGRRLEEGRAERDDARERARQGEPGGKGVDAAHGLSEQHAGARRADARLDGGQHAVAKDLQQPRAGRGVLLRKQPEIAERDPDDDGGRAPELGPPGLDHRGVVGVVVPRRRVEVAAVQVVDDPPVRPLRGTEHTEREAFGRGFTRPRGWRVDHALRPPRFEAGVHVQAKGDHRERDGEEQDPEPSSSRAHPDLFPVGVGGRIVPAHSPARTR
jgi:hypothetical protein